MIYRNAANFEEMAAGTNKRRLIQHTVFQELCKVLNFIIKKLRILKKMC